MNERIATLKTSDRKPLEHDKTTDNKQPNKENGPEKDEH